MATKTKKPKRRNVYADKSLRVMRSVTVQRASVNEEESSVEVVIATENPVERFDWMEGEVIKEVLRMSGATFRGNNKQVPIVDSHNPSTVRNVLGSVRNIKTRNGEMVGTAVFARDEESQVAFQKVRDGHLTDFSITAAPTSILRIQRGEKARVGSQTIEGPAEIVDGWTPLDASLVATGADETSTVRSSVRRSYELPLEPNGVELMKKRSIPREKLIQLGMPSSVVEDGAVQQWITNNLSEQVADNLESQSADEGNNETDETPIEPIAETPSEPVGESTNDSAGDDAGELVGAGAGSEEPMLRAARAERTRIREVQAIGQRFNVAANQIERWVNEGTSVRTVRDWVMDNHVQPGAGTPTGGTTVTRSQIDRVRDGARHALIRRSLAGAGVQATHDEPIGDAPVYENFSLLRMAETILRSANINTDRMTPRDIAAVAMGDRPTIDRLRIQRDGEAYHVTGSFANLLLDAANKTLLAAYEEAPYTWNLWARQASSVADFKNINRIRFSESPDLEVVPENKDYKEGAMSDAKESYSVEKYGKIFTVTWETIVNDDLDAISRVPAMQGAAARRTQNKKVYEALTANAAMADGTALFDAAHSNLAGSAAAPSVAALNSAFVDMMKQTGLDNTTIINVQPRFIIAPVALSATILELLGSISRPEVGGTAAGNANTKNIYGPNGDRPLTPIFEPHLDANSATAWYLAASNTQIDTIELAFLQGEETPVLESEQSFERDVIKYKIRQTFGVKPIDHRGLYKNAGA